MPDSGGPGPVLGGQTWPPWAVLSPDPTWTRALLTCDSRNRKASLLQLLKLSALCLAALRTSGSLVLIVLGNPGFTPELRIWEQKSGRETEPDKNITVGGSLVQGSRLLPLLPVWRPARPPLAIRPPGLFSPPLAVYPAGPSISRPPVRLPSVPVVAPSSAEGQCGGRRRGG